MNRPQAPEGPTDERLSAWLDGEGTPGERAAVERWLAAHPEAARRVQRWAEDRDALRRSLDPVLSEPVPDALLRPLWRPAGAPRRALAAAAGGGLAAGLLVASVAVWLWPGGRVGGASAVPGAQQAAGSAEGWVQRAAYAHAVYTAEPRHAVEVKAQEEHLARWLTRRIAAPVALFDLREWGFELVGGRLLPDAAGKSAQLLYQDAQGLRVTLYLRKPEAGTPAAFRYEQQGELGLFYWVEDGLGYALVGALPKATLLAMAQAVYRQHPPPAPPASAPR